MNRGDGHPATRDRDEIGALLVGVRGLEAVDPVALAASGFVALDELELIVVQALAEARQLDSRDLAGRAVDVDQRVAGERLVDQSAHDLAGYCRGGGEVELAPGVAHAADAGLL